MANLGKTMLFSPVNNRDHFQGNYSAEVVLVEYGNYKSAACKQVYPVIKQLQDVLDNKLLFVYRHFTSVNFHPDAFKAALAAEAAGRQAKFWQMHQLLFIHQQELSSDSIMAYARIIQLETDAFSADLQDSSLHRKIKDDFESGRQSGIHTIPALFINGWLYGGTIDFTSLLQALNR